MKKVKLLVSLLSVCFLIPCCNTYDPFRPTEQANNTLSGLDGEYIVTDMVCEDDPTRLFDLNNDISSPPLLCRFFAVGSLPRRIQETFCRLAVLI